MELDRKKEVISICLDMFVTKGLSETSTRDLAKALKLQNAGLYYYFHSKFDAVVACFEEALSRLEINVVLPSFIDLDNPEKLVHNLLTRAEQMSGLLRFVMEAVSSVPYREALKPSLDRMRKRMDRYSDRVANKLGCTATEIAPYLNMTVSALSEYMLFGDASKIELQMTILKKMLQQKNG